MAISIHISNNLPHLADAMINAIAAQKGNVLRPVYIVTQTQGMNNWLKIRIAEKTGIAANIKFLRPAEIIQEMYQLLGGKMNAKLDRLNLDWLIFAVIGKSEFIKAYPNQAKYYIEERKIDERKMWEFAARIADLFDQYQIYRTQIIEQWSHTDIASLPKEQQWQAFIWKTIKEHAKNQLADNNETKAFIIQALQNEEKSALLLERIGSIFMFGLSIVTPYHLHIFYALQSVLPLHWYLGNPAPEHYWFEDRQEQELFKAKMKGKNVVHASVGNSLLTSWGKVLQQTFRMIFQTEEFINAVNDLPSLAPEGRTLLSRVQADLYQNITEPEPLTEALINDESIKVAVNYSKRREVEVLYNYLLDAVLHDKYGTITERDMIVMVSDINAYAPYIRAVMDNAPYKFQYAIADEQMARGDTLITALVSILQLNAQQLSAEDLLYLLNHKHIRDKFGIYNITLIRETIKTANIRFGIENDYHQPKDDTYLVSWHYGLKKIMYGLCMDTDEQLHFGKQKFYTVESADSVADMQQIAAFAALVQSLAQHLRMRQEARSLSAWEHFISQTIEDLLWVDDLEQDEHMQNIMHKLEHSEELDELLKEQQISYEVFSTRFIEKLNNEAQQATFLSRGITFCSPLPFRSIPFKIIALLGLNYDSFPRKEQRLDFDLMSKKPQLGDRNIKNNDKHLFLESLLSAQNALYLSYIGRSIKDNKPLPPSILIDELLDYIQSAAGPQTDVRKILVEEHPLHSYSVRYNQAEGTLLPNYLMQMPHRWPISEKSNQEPDVHGAAYKISELWLFFNKALNYYYNNILQVYFPQEEAEIQATEHFMLDGLQQWQLKNELIQHVLWHKDAGWQQRQYLNAKLPLKNVGVQVMNEHLLLLNKIQEQLHEDVPASTIPEQRPINYEYKGVKFVGDSLSILNNSILADYSIRSKHEVSLAALKLNYLFVKTIFPDIKTAILYKEDGKKVLNQLEQTAAREQLHRLLDIFLSLRTQPLLFSLDTMQKLDGAISAAAIRKANLKIGENNAYVQHGSQLYNPEEQTESIAMMQEAINILLASEI